MKSKAVASAAAVAAALLLGACGRTPTAPDLQPSVHADGNGQFGSGGYTPTPQRTTPGTGVRADGNGQFGSGGFAPPPDSTQGGGH